jgi:ABC-2 type transport system ATP-binding protein
MEYSVRGMAIEATGLVKRFGSVTALDGLDLAVPEGTVCGLLGPNGAGKTTAVRVLSTLLRLDEGRASVAGFDVARSPREVRFRIGLTGQKDAVEDTLTGRQNLEMFGRLFHLSPRAARARADELLERFGLADAARRPAKAYSGGMRRRLDLAASFVLKPRVLFLDEPTTGQDPRSRNDVWDVVRGFVAEGTTVLLTTHYLEEADQLADQICVVDRGRVIAAGTPTELKARVGGSLIDVVAGDVAAAAGIVERVCGSVTVDADLRRISGPAADPVAALGSVLRGLSEAGVDAEDVALRRPTLDEVFLALTGKPAEDAEGSTAAGESGAAAGAPMPAGRPA